MTNVFISFFEGDSPERFEVFDSLEKAENNFKDYFKYAENQDYGWTIHYFCGVKHYLYSASPKDCWIIEKELQ
jgi:hypothetical protein